MSLKVLKPSEKIAQMRENNRKRMKDQLDRKINEKTTKLQNNNKIQKNQQQWNTIINARKNTTLRR